MALGGSAGCMELPAHLHMTACRIHRCRNGYGFYCTDCTWRWSNCSSLIHSTSSCSPLHSHLCLDSWGTLELEKASWWCYSLLHSYLSLLFWSLTRGSVMTHFLQHFWLCMCRCQHPEVVHYIWPVGQCWWQRRSLGRDLVSLWYSLCPSAVSPRWFPDVASQKPHTGSWLSHPQKRPVGWGHCVLTGAGCQLGGWSGVPWWDVRWSLLGLDWCLARSGGTCWLVEWEMT